MRHVLHRNCILALAAWIGVAGCGRAGGGTTSRGLGHADFLDTLPRVLVDTTPLLTLGRVEPEDDEHTLVTVTWAALPGDSLLVLGDTGARRVGVYGLDGAFRRWLGRVGDGPGEFRSPASGGLTSDDKVWIFDLSRSRVLLFDVGGELVAAIDLKEAYGFGSNPRIIGVDDAGGVWLQLVSGSPSTADVQSGQRYRPDVTIRRITRDSSAVVWTGGGNESVFKIEEFGTSSRSGGLAPKLLTALLADELVLTRSDSTSLDRVTAGGVLHPWLDYPAWRPVDPGLRAGPLTAGTPQRPASAFTAAITIGLAHPGISPGGAICRTEPSITWRSSVGRGGSPLAKATEWLLSKTRTSLTTGRRRTRFSRLVSQRSRILDSGMSWPPAATRAFTRSM